MARVVLIANQRKPEVEAALTEFRPWLAQRAEIVEDFDAYDSAPLRAKDVDLVIVMGGDGTMLAQARRTVDLGAPLLGINFGKLGFLAPFKLEQVQADWDRIIAGELTTRPRVLLEVTARSAVEEEVSFRSLAMNDLVVTAGPPFRMIELELSINAGSDPSVGTVVTGDGLIVATPVGSTAYNLSAGGPIIAPDVDGLVVSAICPQTLAFRPIVLNAADEVLLRLNHANAGTTAVVDGQVTTPLTTGSVISVRAYSERLQLVVNPRLGYWKTLAKKMHWAARPRQV